MTSKHLLKLVISFGFHLLCIAHTDAEKSVTRLFLMHDPRGYIGDSSILQDSHKI